ncbi:MAG: VOC family protein [Candidatus Bathyarchaeota archaeon]
MQFSHVSITVKAMEETIKFYREVVGLELVSRREIPENKAEIAFLTDKISNVRVELTYWQDKKDWTSGDELDHLAFTLPNLDEAMKKFRRQGVEIAKEPYSLKGSTSKIAFIKDPNGIWIELIETK